MLKEIIDMKEKIVSFIPVKLNNQRLPGKNIKELNGRPLCDYLFKTISEITEINEKYVYCSDEAICQYIEPYKDQGLSFLKRDSYLDGNEIKGLEIIKRFVEDVEADIYVLAHVTQPFSKHETIVEGIRKVAEEGYDSAFSALKLQDYLWLNGKPMNYDPTDIIRTQDMDPVYMETGAFFIFRREVFTKMGRRIGINPFICEVDHFEAIDIDDMNDYLFAEAAARYLKEAELI